MNMILQDIKSAGEIHFEEETTGLTAGQHSLQTQTSFVTVYTFDIYTFFYKLNTDFVECF